ncbi:hypothetical protein [Flavobacterium sp. UBA4197]|uniref:hypothetical protein n=1 Tax=Flavobacterium sp. UBA4197 TaxID=1946546 RepID=UPI00257C308F|nr:hypothetical protein [Flavobacterium sp. UBA4197]
MENTPQQNNNASGFIFFLAFVAFAFIGITLSHSGKKKSVTPVTETEKINCVLCGIDLTDTNNRIQPNGKAYFCMPCYHKMLDDGSNTSSESSYSEYDYSSSNNVQNESGYSTGSDGRIYENAPCSLCNGTGIEEATAANPYTGERTRRVCPQCQGKGHQNY